MNRVVSRWMPRTASRIPRCTGLRFAKRTLDEFVFLGNRLQVFNAPQLEAVSDSEEKLETRWKEVLARVNSSAATKQVGPSKSSSNASQETILGSEWNRSQPESIHHLKNNPLLEFRLNRIILHHRR